MGTSLSTQLRNRFVAMIVIIIMGVLAGVYYLVNDYFFEMKEQELTDKGNEMAETVETFIRMDDENKIGRAHV